MALKRIGCKQIAMTLNREGFFTSTRQRWGKTTMHKILNKEAYSGTLVFGGRPGHPAINSGEPPMRVENAWPSIVDKETFQQVQNIMSKNAPKEVHPRIIPSFYLLSGILYCSCGRAMVGRSAKSHKYYYYTCNRNCKQGREACNSKILPKEKIERLVIDQIKNKILDGKYLEELVRLVNEDLNASYSLFKEKIASIDIETHEVESRLARLYDALETGKLNLNDLAPRIKKLRAKQDELSKAKVISEAEMTLQGYQQIDMDAVRLYVEDLRNLLDESEVAQRKAFLRSFVKKIVIDKEKVRLYYNIPIPPDGHADGKKIEELGVLPIDTPGGAGVSIGRTGSDFPVSLPGNGNLYSTFTLPSSMTISFYERAKKGLALSKVSFFQNTFQICGICLYSVGISHLLGLFLSAIIRLP